MCLSESLEQKNPAAKQLPDRILMFIFLIDDVQAF